MGPRASRRQKLDGAQGGAAKTPPQPPRHPEWQEHSSTWTALFDEQRDLRTMIDDRWIQVVLNVRNFSEGGWTFPHLRPRCNAFLCDLSRDVVIAELATDDVEKAKAFFEDVKARAPDYLMEESL